MSTVEALKMAIEALEEAQDMIGDGGSSVPNYFKIQINTCKSALSEIENSEPVAWVYAEDIKQLCRDFSSINGNVYIKDVESCIDAMTNTFPPKREWVGLNDDEIQDMARNDKYWISAIGFNTAFHWSAFAKAIEAKLKELNQ